MERGLTLPGVLKDMEQFQGLRPDEYAISTLGADSDTAILSWAGEPHAVVKTLLYPGHPHTHRHLLSESLVVATLEEASKVEPAPFELPRVLHSQLQRAPYYAAFSYVPGAILDFPELVDIPDHNKTTIGRQLAEAVYWIERHLTIDAVPEIAHRDVQPNHLLRLSLAKGYIPQYEKIAAAGFDEIAEALCATVARVEEHFTHDDLEASGYGHVDLNSLNMTFDVTPGAVALRGIFDFGCSNMRPTEYEFRFFNFISPYYTEGIVERYSELSGRELDVEKMNTWSAIQLLNSILYRICHEYPLKGKYAWEVEQFLKRRELYAI